MGQRRFGRIGIVAGWVALMVLVGTGLTRPASAQEPSATSTTTVDQAGVDRGCDQIVFDQSGAFGPLDAVNPAVFRLAAAGTEVHLRLVDDVPDTDEVHELEQQCGWAEGGNRNPRAVELFVALDGDAGLWYGSDLSAWIGAQFAELRSDLGRDGTTDVAEVAGLLDRLSRVIGAERPVDPLGCDQLLWDPGNGLGSGRDAVADAAMGLQADGNDLRVRVEPPTDGDLDDRLEQLEQTCPGWEVDGDRPTDRVIVMVQPTSRSTGLWYGADFSDSLSSRWESIQTEAMNPRFKEGDFAGGLSAGLDRLVRSHGGSRSGLSGEDFARLLDDYERDHPYDRDRSYRKAPTGPGAGAYAVVVGLLILFMGGGVGISYLSWKAKFDRGETEDSFSEHNRKNRPRVGYRSSGGRRSFGGGGSHRSSGGGGGSRSSGGGGGGHRSGGGSTKW